MKAAVCLLLVSGLLAGQAKGFWKSQELFDSPELFDSGEDDSWELFDWGRRKRDVQQVFQTQGQVPFPYQQDSHRYPQVSEGVEPLLPVDGLTPDDIADGVEPVGSRGDGSAIGSWWRRFSGRVEDTFDSLGDKIDSIGDTLQQTFHRLKERVAYIVVRFKTVMVKFGIVVQEGIKYCIQRFQHSINQGKHLEVIEKLETKLEEGHEEVVKFFHILGEKIHAWRQQHRYDDIDIGLIDVQGPGGQNQQTQGQQTQQMPNFYQDIQVLSQLDRLREQGVLTQNEIIILTEDQDQQQQQHQQQQQQQQQQQSQQNIYQQRRTPVKPEEPEIIRVPEFER